MTRVLAVVVAIGLVLGAIAVRNAMDHGDGAGGSNNPEGIPTITVVCAEELRNACENLGFGPRYEITVEDAADTAERLRSASVDIDVWAVPDPWPGIVDDGRVRAGLDPLFEDVGPPVARSPFVVVGPEDLAGCAWRCIGERAAGGLRLGARSLASGLGTLQLGAMSAGWFGRTDFATNDFDGAFTSWLSGVASGTTVDERPVTQLLLSPAFFDAALSYEAEATAAFDSASADRRAGLALLYPQPVAYLDVLVVDLDGALDDAASNLPSSIAAALRDRGWQEVDGSGSGLPRPGVLVALQGLV